MQSRWFGSFLNGVNLPYIVALDCILISTTMKNCEKNNARKSSACDYICELIYAVKPGNVAPARGGG